MRCFFVLEQALFPLSCSTTCYSCRNTTNFCILPGATPRTSLGASPTLRAREVVVPATVYKPSSPPQDVHVVPETPQHWGDNSDLGLTPPRNNKFFPSFQLDSPDNHQGDANDVANTSDSLSPTLDWDVTVNSFLNERLANSQSAVGPVADAQSPAAGKLTNSRVSASEELTNEQCAAKEPTDSKSSIERVDSSMSSFVRDDQVEMDSSLGASCIDDELDRIACGLSSDKAGDTNRKCNIVTPARQVTVVESSLSKTAEQVTVMESSLSKTTEQVTVIESSLSKTSADYAKHKKKLKFVPPFIRTSVGMPSIDKGNESKRIVAAANVDDSLQCSKPASCSKRRQSVSKKTSISNLLSLHSKAVSLSKTHIPNAQLSQASSQPETTSMVVTKRIDEPKSFVQAVESGQLKAQDNFAELSSSSISTSKLRRKSASVRQPSQLLDNDQEKTKRKDNASQNSGGEKASVLPDHLSTCRSSDTVNVGTTGMLLVL